MSTVHKTLAARRRSLRRASFVAWETRHPEDRTDPPAGWIWFSLLILSRCYRAVLLSLLAAALVPTLWSWSGFLVRSGSMEPGISVGDVVVTQPFDAQEKVPVGRVMLFRASTDAGGATRTRLHRVVADRGDGTYTTAGDANRSVDSDPLSKDALFARAVILVPYVGKPMVWLAEGTFAPLALWLLGTMLALHLSFQDLNGTGPQPRRRRRRPSPPEPDATRPRFPVPRLPEPQNRVIAFGVIASVLLLPSTSAAFTASSRNHSNTWSAGSMVQPYTAAVLADTPYAFYRLDEASGTTALDQGGNNLTGTYTAVAAYRQPGALPHNTGYAVRLAAATGRMVGGGTGLSDPTTFSVELWFRTSSTAGGKLIGFENSRNQTSSLYDREAFLRPDGRVVYLGGTSATKLLVSPGPLNDNAWHHLVITAVPSGANEVTAMYVDGVLAASGNTAKATSAYTGWWRVGYGRVPAGVGYPTTGNYTGLVDDVAIYRTQLGSARVAAHFAAR